MKTSFTVITIVKGRRKQLHNQQLGITHSSLMSVEHIVVLMDDEPIELHSELTSRTIRINSKESLPLALARNEGWRAATTEAVIFLDVDCIPSPGLFQRLLDELDDTTIVTEYPRYLPVVPDGSWSFDELQSRSIEHPGRVAIPSDVPVKPELFWSLIFAARRSTLQTIDGFDETYTGYGAEDTDFAMTAAASGIDIVFVKETVLHQYHDKYDPPLQHFKDIIMNAERYKDKWGVWAMKTWLDTFEELGLVRINDTIDIVSQPTEDMIRSSHSTLPY